MKIKVGQTRVYKDGREVQVVKRYPDGRFKMEFEDGDEQFPYENTHVDYRTKQEFAKWLKTPEGKAAEEEIERTRFRAFIRSFLDDLLDDPVDRRTLLTPPPFMQKDEQLAREWAKGRQVSMNTMISARVAEKAVGHYYSRAGHSVEDVAMAQLDNPDSEEWKLADLRVNQSYVDVKNVRIWSKDGHRFSSHTVSKFKTDEHGRDIRMAGVLSEYYGDNTLAMARNPVRFLGEASRERISDLKEMLRGGPLILSLSESPISTKSRLPPWLFDCPSSEFKIRDRKLAELTKGNPGEAESKILNMPTVAIAAGVTPAAPDGDFNRRKLVERLVERRRRYGLSLPVVYLTILEHFLELIKSDHSLSLPQGYFSDLIYPTEDESRPLFLFDSQRTVKALLGILNALKQSDSHELGKMRIFQLAGFEILRAKAHESDNTWKTLVAYCGECSVTQLVLGLGDCRLCPNGRLLCPHCGYCCGGCNWNDLRNEYSNDQKEF